MNFCEELEFGQIAYGRHFPVWHYREIPTGMRPAIYSDIQPGNKVLYQVRIGPHKGEYYTAIVTQGARMEILRHYVKSGIPVYVKS